MRFKIKTIVFRKKGFSLIETIIYTAMLSVLIGAIVSGTSILFKSYKSTKDLRQIENSALNSMDRIIREIRNAESVDIANSSFNVSSGALTLVSGGGATTTRFYLSDQRLYIDENGASFGAITNSGIKVTSLIFRHIATSTYEAVKVELTLTSSSTPSISKNFYDGAVVRGSY